MYFAETPVGILIRTVFSLQINLDSITILTILSLIIHQHAISFSLFITSLIAFNNVL